MQAKAKDFNEVASKKGKIYKEGGGKRIWIFFKTWELDSGGWHLNVWSRLSPDICGDVDEAARKEDKEEEEQANRIDKL